MAKLRSSYVCQSCEYSQVGWSGRCPNCGEWNTLVETIVSTGQEGKKVKGKNINTKPKSLYDIKIGKNSRISTKISELDRVLGGGMVAGQVVLIAGEPGVGKSTILLQLVNNILESLYVSAEESASQIKIRADRLGIKNKELKVMETNNVDHIVEIVDKLDKGVVIVDSIQTLQTSDLSGMAGSIGQIRECTYRLVGAAKKTNIPIFIVGHVTKEGSIGGPMYLAHLVDTVLTFEGEKTSILRILRANKNRFGPTDEAGIFEMKEGGLESVIDPTKAFVTSTGNMPGSVVTSVLEGSRPILAEIQSLVVPSKLINPRRVVQGIDPRRVELLLAILARRCGIPANTSDIFVNVVGGISIREPGIDLGVALSLASAYFDKQLPAKTLSIGEVDLLGAIRQASSQDKRINEAKRLGYKNIISSKEFSYLSQAIRKYLR